MGFKYLVLILLNICVSLAKFSELSVEVEEIHLLENEPLELNCTGFNQKFIYPTNSTSGVPTSSVEIIEDREKGKVLLRRNKTGYGDTGWYGCLDSYDFPINSTIEHENITPDNYHKINLKWANVSVKWIYVYVKSSEHNFVQLRETVQTINIEAGNDAVLSCRLTSPDYTVKLYSDGQEIDLNSRLSFDPRRGFLLKNVTIKDSSYYQCIADESSEEVDYLLHVIRRRTSEKILKPVIRFSRERLVVDKELVINCSIETDIDSVFILDWKIPQSDKESSNYFIRELIDSNSIRYTNRLTIKNFTHDEEGIYECDHTTHDGHNSTSIDITLADAEFHLETQKLINEGNKNNYTNGYLIPDFVGLNCSDKVELSPAAVESLKNSIVNEIKRNLTDIISNAVKEYFEKYLMSAFSSRESKNSLIFSILAPMTDPYYYVARSQNSTRTFTATTPYYYPTRIQNSTESVTETTPYYFSQTNQTSSDFEEYEGIDTIFEDLK